MRNFALFATGAFCALRIAACTVSAPAPSHFAEQLIERGQYRDAITLLEAERNAALQASRCDRAFAVTLNNLGSAYYEAGRYLDAEHAYEASLLARRSLPTPNATDASDTAPPLTNRRPPYLASPHIPKPRPPHT